MKVTAQERLRNAQASLTGLSVGDAFGDRFFTNPAEVERLIEARSAPAPPWLFTDDTVMALSVVDVLSDRGAVDEDWLAELFATRYRFDPARGYGATAHGILTRIGAGESWRDVAPSVFNGRGSMGNGGAMRAAPIGAYFFDDVARVVAEAHRSAAVTHAHPEGQAGAIAVAVAAAWVARGGDAVSDLFAELLTHTPDSETRAGIEKASRLPTEYDVRTAVSALGNGLQLTAQDTVPFCIWNVARNLRSFEEAMWSTVSGLGDRDTTAAIVGGIIATRRDVVIPPDWLEAREPLESMSRELLGPRYRKTPDAR
jgi:ADP-ribosylglycohydrolase